jgi:hypothetical protein
MSDFGRVGTEKQGYYERHARVPYGNHGTRAFDAESQGINTPGACVICTVRPATRKVPVRELVVVFAAAV